MEGSDSIHGVLDGSSINCNSQSQARNELFLLPTVAKRHFGREHKRKKLLSTSLTAAITCKSDTKHLTATPGSILKVASVCDNFNLGFKHSGNVVNTVPESGSGLVCEGNHSLQPVRNISMQPSEEMEMDVDVSRNLENQDASFLSAQNDNANAHICETKNGFSTIISLHDGVVLCTSSSISSVLGFPKDMWIGRSFIDFVHPKDREVFASHIATGISLQLEETHNKGKEIFFCCLRQYKGLRSSGFGVTEKKVTYRPFHLTITFKEVSDVEKIGVDYDDSSAHGLFLIITATLVRSAYTYADEKKVSPKFVTRHLATCRVSHVDPDVVTYLGYLPQDMLGHSVFEFYHPEDSPFLKEVHEGVIKGQGHPFRSKPYHFRVQNGGYVLLETEWSGFVNPWSRKLEFVIGQHRVLKGPSNPDVFALPKDDDNMAPVSEEFLKESRIIQEEITSLLKETVQQNRNLTKQQISKRQKNWDILMTKGLKPELNVDLPRDQQCLAKNIFHPKEKNSIMLGEISPNHGNNNSKSSQTPSYNTLNYNENIMRFFESRPKTTVSSESSESKMQPNTSLKNVHGDKSTPNEDSSLDSSERKHCSPVGKYASCSEDNSEGTGKPTNDTSTKKNFHASYKVSHLTKALLNRHNEDMEKEMAQKHREKNVKWEDNESNKKVTNENLQEQSQHGVKRSVSHSWDGDTFNGKKHPHRENLLSSDNAMSVPSPNTVAGATTPVSSLCQSSPNISLWPPFSLSVTPLQSTQPCTAHNGFPHGAFGNPTALHVASMMHLYYIPTQSQQTTSFKPGEVKLDVPQEHSSPHPISSCGSSSDMTPQVLFMNHVPNMLFHPLPSIYGTTPMYSSMMFQPSTVLPAPVTHSSFISSPHVMKIEKSHTKELTECSKTQKFSPEGSALFTDIICDRNKTKNNNEENNFSDLKEVDSTLDGSSYSSFYSLFCTDKSNESVNCSVTDKDFHVTCDKKDVTWEKYKNESTTYQENSRPVLERKKKHCNMEHKLAMVFEENTPLPPPV